MNVVVAGGTGFLGHAITGALLDAGHRVTVLSRSRPQGDWMDSRAPRTPTMPGTCRTSPSRPA